MILAADGSRDDLPLLTKRQVADRLLDRWSRRWTNVMPGRTLPDHGGHPMSAQPETVRRLSVVDIAKLYADGVRIATITAYDFPTAALVDEAGIPLILVGDSLAQVMLGYDTTVRVSMDEMLHHTKAVVRGSKRALIVGDMPFLSYATPDDAVANAGRFLREGGAQAVKIEGGVRSARTIEALVRPGSRSWATSGSRPQAINAIGRVRVQGKSKEQARALLADALAVQEAGAFAIVLELVPGQLAAAITERLRIPTIGIGAGAGCSGQIQVITDTLGWGDWTPKHARKYADLRGTIIEAIRGYRDGRGGRGLPRPGGDRADGPGRARRGPRAGPTRTVSEPRGWRTSPASRSTATSRRGSPTRPRTGPTRMQIVRTRAELRTVLAAATRPIGLVPTMGWLHDGHVSLVDRARAESATVVVSIFVNPRQFGQSADFARYPRNEARDLAVCEASGVDVVFAPSVDEVYPPGFDTRVVVGAIAGPLEGAARPGHFDGVATVVAILFALVGAERAYFGLKDYQQVQVIRRMATDLALPTEVVPCETVREPDGLALSSRNARLTPEGRAAAPVLRRALLAGAARSGPASGPAPPCATRCWRCSRRNRRRHRTTCPSPTPTRSRSWTRSPAGRCCPSRR